jgi:hypothetical protein
LHQVALETDSTDLPPAGVTDAALEEARALAQAAVRARRAEESRRIAEARELEETAREGAAEGWVEIAEYAELRDDRIHLEWLYGRRRDLPDRIVEMLGVQPTFVVPGLERREPEVRRRPPRPSRPAGRRRWKQLPLPTVARWRPPRRRKCNPNPRAYTWNTEALRSLIRREKDITHLEVVAWQGERPRTRAECQDGPRPCPWVGCRSHTALESNPENGSVKEMYPHLRIFSDPEGDGLDRLEQAHGTCSLDRSDRLDPYYAMKPEDRPAWLFPGYGGLLRLRQVAESGEPIGQTDAMELEAVAEVFGQSHENIREIGSAALQQVRVAIRREGNARVPRGLIQLRAPTEKARPCPASGCNQVADVMGVACAGHWQRVSRTARLKLWAAWPLTIDQRDAAREAVQMTREESGTMETKDEGAGPGDVGAQPTEEMPEEPTHPQAVVDERQMGLFGGGEPAPASGEGGG